ncbi:MAG: hypothetical protein AAFP89_20815 [Bacteroidota bacterium]
MNLIYSILIGIGLLILTLFVIWGYKDDFERDPKSVRIAGLILLTIAGLVFRIYSEEAWGWTWKFYS